jgi:hypothetical protein
MRMWVVGSLLLVACGSAGGADAGAPNLLGFELTRWGDGSNLVTGGYKWRGPGFMSSLSCTTTQTAHCERTDCTKNGMGQNPALANAGVVFIDGGSGRSWTFSYTHEGYSAAETGTGWPATDGQAITLDASGGADVDAFTLGVASPKAPAVVAGTVVSLSATSDTRIALSSASDALLTVSVRTSDQSTGNSKAVTCTAAPGATAVTVDAAALRDMSGFPSLELEVKNVSAQQVGDYNVELEIGAHLLLPDAGELSAQIGP